MEPAASGSGLLRGNSCGQPVFPRDVLGLKVLVVDDDPTCLMIVAGMLRKCRYEGTPPPPPRSPPATLPSALQVPSSVLRVLKWLRTATSHFLELSGALK